jgi:hypothetical protein
MSSYHVLITNKLTLEFFEKTLELLGIFTPKRYFFQNGIFPHPNVDLCGCMACGLYACCVFVWCCVCGGWLLEVVGGPDARFSFPDRRHSSLSEVYPGVSVPSRLISCPPSLPVLRSVSRSASPSRQDELANLIYECFPPKRAGEFNIRIRGLVMHSSLQKLPPIATWHPLNPVVPVPPAKKSRRRRSKQ